jgi:hypothetical protein
MRAIMAVRNKVMRSLRASKLCEVPRSKLKYKINNNEQNIEKSTNIRNCRKAILMKQISGIFFSGTGYVGEIRNIVFLISHTVFFHSLKKG